MRSDCVWLVYWGVVSRSFDPEEVDAFLRENEGFIGPVRVFSHPPSLDEVEQVRIDGLADWAEAKSR